MSAAHATLMPEPDIEQQPAASADAEAAAAHEQAVRHNTMRTLLSAMMVGQLMGYKDDAKRIFDAMGAFMGDKNQLRISLAFASAMAGDPVPAQELLREGIDDWPSPEMTKLALSLALKQAGDPEWESLPQHMLAASADTEVREFARRLLTVPEDEQG